MRMMFIFGVMVTAVPASAMDVATFLKQMEAVQNMGMRAMLSDQPKLLFSEMNTATASLREERLAAVAAGRKPAYCPDPDNRAQPS